MASMSWFGWLLTMQVTTINMLIKYGLK